MDMNFMHTTINNFYAIGDCGDCGDEDYDKMLASREQNQEKSQENIIATSQKLDDIRRSIYIGECVNVKYQDPEVQNKRYTIDRTGTICYIHKNYFNVKFDDTGIQESYTLLDVLEGTVLINEKGIK